MRRLYRLFLLFLCVSVLYGADFDFRFGFLSTDDPLIFSDTMTDTTGVTLPDHTPDLDPSGNGWTQRIGDATWQIDTNTAKLGVAGTNPGNDANVRHVYVDVGVSDFIFEANVKYDSGANGANGVMFRGSAETGSGINLWQYRLRDNGNEELREVEDGSVTLRDSAVHGAVNGTSYKLTVIASGTTIRCYRDGALKLSYASATFNQTATRMGLRADGRQLTDKAFDNVSISSFTGFP